MTKQLEQELTAWMQRQADQAPYDTDLEPGAFRKSRRIRLQRRITSAIVAAAILGLAVPASLQAMNLATGPDQPQVVDTPTTIETPQPEPAPAGPVRIDFDRLPSGATTLPWWSSSDSSIHDGTAVFSNIPSLTELAKLGEHQYAVVMDPERNGLEDIQLIGVRDPTTVAVKGSYSLAISQSGEELAWIANNSEGLYQVNVASTKTGQLVDSYPLEKADSFHVVGFAGRDVLLSSDRGALRTETKLWLRDMPKGYVLPITNAMYGVATAPNGRRASVLHELEDEKSGNGRWCSGVVNLPELSQVWKSCDLMAVALSPDGRYALTQPSNTEGAGAGTYTIVDLRTGKAGLRISADLFTQFAWEADGKHFVVEALNDGKAALVRSDLHGNLELVTDPVAYDFPADNPPYVLGTR